MRSNLDASISDRIIHNDCIVFESDFYPPEDTRGIVSSFVDDKDSEPYYEYFEDYNDLQDYEEIFDI